MDLQAFLKKYHSDLKETQSFLNMYCKNIQTALNNIQAKEAELSKPSDQDDGIDEDNELGDIKINEIDALIEKAQKVFVDDPTLKGKNKSIKKQDMKPPINGKMVSKIKASDSKSSGKPIFRASSTSTNRNYVKGHERKCLVRKELNSVKENIDTNNRNIPNEPCSKDISKKESDQSDKLQNAGSRVVPNMSSKANKDQSSVHYFDDVFKEEYCYYHKLKRELSKLQHNQTSIKEIKTAKNLFMDSITPTVDLIKIAPSIVDVEKLMLQCYEVLPTYELLQKISLNTIQTYVKNQKNQSNFLTNEEMKNYTKLLQLKFHLLFQQKLNTLITNHFQGNDEVQISHYRQLCLLFNYMYKFPSLLDNQ